MRTFTVAADLDVSAHVFFLERDSVAFRCLLAKVSVACQILVVASLNAPWLSSPLTAQALDLGSLEFEKEVSEGKVVTVWQATHPQFDKYVPSAFVKMAQKLIGNSLVFTDILSYDSAKLQQPPFEIAVTSIAPVFKDKVKFSIHLFFHECSQSFNSCWALT